MKTKRIAVLFAVVLFLSQIIAPSQAQAAAPPFGVQPPLQAAQSGPSQVESVAAVLTGATQIAAGVSHSCALLASGAVKCWGRNDVSQVGDDSTSNRLIPTIVYGLSRGVASIATTKDHTCAVGNNGKAACWGLNTSGQLGNGVTTTTAIPVVVSGIAPDISSIATGADFTCALLVTNGVKCWGYGGSGQLGNASNANSLTPVDVSGLITGVAAIAAGWGHACALLSTGAVKCWGTNGFGQLGVNAPSSSNTPVQVTGLTSGVTAIAADWNHVCALLNTGAVKCWGDNNYRQLGDGTSTPSPTPVQVSGLISGVVKIAAGQTHSCAVLNTGTATCWGYNWFGQLGGGHKTEPITTTVVVTGLTGVADISGGGLHTCAMLSTGAVKCWGYGAMGRLGNNYTGESSVPVGSLIYAASAPIIER